MTTEVPYPPDVILQRAATLKAVDYSDTYMVGKLVQYRYAVFDSKYFRYATPWVSSLDLLPSVISLTGYRSLRIRVLLEVRVFYRFSDVDSGFLPIDRKLVRREPNILIYPLKTRTFSGRAELFADRLRMRVKRIRSPRARMLGPFTAQRPASESKQKSVRRWRFNGLTVTHNTAIASLIYSRTWTGVRTPNYGRLHRKRLPINNHTVFLKWHDDGGYVYEVRKTATNEVIDIRVDPFEDHLGGNGGGTPPVLDQISPGISAARVRAQKRLATRAGEAINGNIALDLVQANQTVRLIGTSVKRIVGAVSGLKKGNIQQAINQLWGPSRKPRFEPKRIPSKEKSLANNWLELQYGWKPLLMDIRGSMESLAKFNLADYSVKRLRSSAKSHEETSVAITDANGQATIGSRKLFLEATIKFGLTYRVNSQLTSYLAQSGFTNPINILWEVIPFSFVVDWFLPIGPWLEALSNFEGVDILDGYSVQYFHQKQVNRVYYHGQDPWNASNTALYSGRMSWEEIQVHRYKYSAWNFVEDKALPRFKNPLTTGHALNALALLKAVFGR